MKPLTNRTFFCLFIVLSMVKLNAQTNNFKIGVVDWGNHFTKTATNEVFTGVYKPFSTDPSSIFNTLKEDGVDIVRTYEPTNQTENNVQRNKKFYKDYLQLIGNNNMQVMAYTEFWCKRINNTVSSFGTQWNLDNADSYFLNYDQQFSEVYNQSPYKEIIWGGDIMGEYNVNSPYPYYGVRPWAWVGGAGWGKGLIPVNIAQDGFNHFTNIKNIYCPKFKLLNCPGPHNEHIDIPQHSDRINMPNKGDACYEAGYFPWQMIHEYDGTPERDRGLWKFDNIDFCKKYGGVLNLLI